jgi:hypothetical protein
MLWPHVQVAQRELAAIAPGDIQKHTLRIMALLLPLRMLTSCPAALSAKDLKGGGARAAAADGDGARRLLAPALQRALEAGGVDPGRSATVVAQLRSGAEECTVCLEVLEDPVATGCGHVYCLECISSVLQAAAPAGAGPCPTCRQPVQRKALLSLKVVFGRIVVLEIEAPNLLANMVYSG